MKIINKIGMWIEENILAIVVGFALGIFVMMQ